MNITMDDVCMIIGAKELELFQMRKELARTREVLARVTETKEEKGDGKEEVNGAEGS